MNKGEKLILEPNSLRKFYNSLLEGKRYRKEHENILVPVFQKLISKSEDANAPISNAHYSSLLLYEKNAVLESFLGANIDPPRREDFNNIHKRNCAEKQASIAAQEFGLNNRFLKMIFLYRNLEESKSFSAEKLLPCSDCYSRFVQDLIYNRGFLLILIGDGKARNFYVSSAKADSNIVMLKHGDQVFYYKIFDHKQLRFLNIEKELGKRVSESCSEILQ